MPHKPLTFAFEKAVDPCSSRQQRHLVYVSEFTTDVRHVAEKHNMVADALSRRIVIAINAVLPNINYSKIAQAQAQHEEIRAYRTAITGLKLEDIPLGLSESILCDISMGKPSPILPQAWRRKIFNLVHGLSHPSIRTTRCIITDHVVWHGIGKQITFWAKTCTACQVSKISSTPNHLLNNSRSQSGDLSTSMWT